MTLTLVELLDTTSDTALSDLPCRTDADHGEAWFSDAPSQIAAAKQACAACPVREACLRAALDLNPRYGVWGGLDRLERRRLALQAKTRTQVAA